MADTLFNLMSMPKLIQLAKEKFPELVFIRQNFRTFDSRTGAEIVEKMCALEYLSVIKKHVESKNCALASLAGLYDFLGTKEISFVARTMRMEFLVNFGCSIDVDTARRLELVEPAFISNRRSKFSLMALLDTCVTKFGKKALRASILEPSCDPSAIVEKQVCVAELLGPNGIRNNARMALDSFKDVHKLMKLPYSIMVVSL